MYSTCLFCNSELGRNEALYDFPVGRRLAFDSGRGRLWVVCRQCERWNLTPPEERWEAIEQAERQFSNTRQRVSTEHIGLSRLRDGTELVRIGTPLRPEFAAWRYGDQFGRRRRRQMLIAGGTEGYLEHLSRYAAEATAVRQKAGSSIRKPTQSGWTMAYISGLIRSDAARSSRARDGTARRGGAARAAG